MIAPNYSRILPYKISCLLSVLLICASISYSQTLSDLYFIYGAPAKLLPIAIYSLDEQSHELRKIWSQEKNKITYSIDVYTRTGPVIIAEMPNYKASPTGLRIISKENVLNADTLSLINYPYVANYTYHEIQNGISRIVFRVSESGNDGRPQYRNIIAEIGQDKGMKNESFLASSDNIRLAGPRNSYAGGYKHDIINCRLTSDGVMMPIGLDIELNLPNVPDSIVIMKESNGWNMLANEPEYSAFESVPMESGTTQRELLIFNRSLMKWNSLLIKGSQTYVNPLDGWLKGVVANADPRNDYASHVGYSPILSDEVILVDPLKVHAFTVKLGSNCEILWVENGIVYYRIGDSLYKARIQNDDFVERNLLMKDPIIEDIHWAFRGSLGVGK